MHFIVVEDEFIFIVCHFYVQRANQRQWVEIKSQNIKYSYLS
jgi:hypothetical protein